MGFNNKIVEDALVASERCCCLCHTFCGQKIELHHIKQKSEGGEDSFDNCIPLCLNCHAEVKAYNPKHPKGRKYTESELIRHRDNWYRKVENGFAFIQQNEPSKLDIELMSKISEVFNYPDLEHYIAEFDFGYAFNNDVFHVLHELTFNFKKAEYEFIDEELEKLKGNLMKCIDLFLSYKASNTFRTDFGTRAIRAWQDDYFEKEDRAIVEQLNQLSDNVWNAYQSLVRESRRRFAY